MNSDFHKLDTVTDFKAPHIKDKVPLPKKIGPYKIESLLNQGGMSLLYLGIDPRTAEPIAVKVLLPKFFKNKEVTTRFLNEAKIIEGAQHPNIVKLYEVGEWEKGVYIAMEFIRGISLRQFIQKQSFSLKKALEIILEVASALSHLHAHGIIHRDLKPENILITEIGSIKLIDFGISQLQNEINPAQEHPRMGTPFYMSPEQIENPNHITFLTDIYALGIIAYELILGKSSHGIVQSSLLPPLLRKIIEKALEINPKLRYQNISDFTKDISLYLIESESRKETLTELPSIDPLEYIQSLLLPKKGIRSAQMEMALSVRKGTSLACPYLDFFPLSENRLIIVLAQSTHLDAASLTHTAVLRGILRMAVESSFQNGKTPIEMLHLVNTVLNKDPMKEKFHLSLLLLNPEKNLLSFVSCDYADLWHIEEGSKKVRELSTPNPAIGESSHLELIETTDNWNAGDLLILHSKKAINQTPQELLDSISSETKLLYPQDLAKKLSERLNSENLSEEQISSVVLTLHRIY